jgi:hypothetical protein
MVGGGSQRVWLAAQGAPGVLLLLLLQGCRHTRTRLQACLVSSCSRRGTHSSRRRSRGPPCWCALHQL